MDLNEMVRGQKVKSKKPTELYLGDPNIYIRKAKIVRALYLFVEGGTNWFSPKKAICESRSLMKNGPKGLKGWYF